MLSLKTLLSDYWFYFYLLLLGIWMTLMLIYFAMKYSINTTYSNKELHESKIKRLKAVKISLIVCSVVFGIATLPVGYQMIHAGYRMIMDRVINHQEASVKRFADELSKELDELKSLYYSKEENLTDGIKFDSDRNSYPVSDPLKASLVKLTEEAFENYSNQLRSTILNFSKKLSLKNRKLLLKHHEDLFKLPGNEYDIPTRQLDAMRSVARGL